MKLSVPKESLPTEKRVAISPGNVAALMTLGYQVTVQSGAGQQANFTDELYEEAGAVLIDDSSPLWGEADLLLKINPPTDEEVTLFKEGATLISFAYPARNEKLLQSLGHERLIG